MYGVAPDWIIICNYWNYINLAENCVNSEKNWKLVCIFRKSFENFEFKMEN